MKYRDFLNESLDTKFKIIKKEIIHDVEFYYIDPSEMDNKLYRIFIETQEIDGFIGLHIGFERYKSNEWVIKGLTNDTTTLELMSLFGTIKSILKTKKCNSISIFTDEGKKLKLYQRMLLKASKEFGFNQSGVDEDTVYVYNEIGYRPDKQIWKYKVK